MCRVILGTLGSVHLFSMHVNKKRCLRSYEGVHGSVLEAPARMSMPGKHDPAINVELWKQKMTFKQQECRRFGFYFFEQKPKTCIHGCGVRGVCFELICRVALHNKK